MNSLLDKNADTVEAKKVIMSLMIKTVGERDYSAQEVMTIVFGWDLYCSSRQFTTLCINESDWANVNINHSDGSLREGKKLLQKYRERPATEQFENMTLLHFAKNHYTTKVRGQVHYATKRKEMIVRIFPKLKLTHNDDEDEKYYRLHSILNSSFRETENFDELLNPEYDNPNDWLRQADPNRGPHPSWKSKFFSLGLSVNAPFELPVIEEEDEGEQPERINEEDERDPIMVAAAMVNNIQLPRVEEPAQEALGKF